MGKTFTFAVVIAVAALLPLSVNAAPSSVSSALKITAVNGYTSGGVIFYTNTSHCGDTSFRLDPNSIGKKEMLSILLTAVTTQQSVKVITIECSSYSNSSYIRGVQLRSS